MVVFIEMRDPDTCNRMYQSENNWYGFGTHTDAVNGATARGEGYLVEMLHHRASMLVSCGLDPENSTHWGITDDAITTLNQMAKSMKYFGHPDATPDQIVFAELISPLVTLRDELVEKWRAGILRELFE